MVVCLVAWDGRQAVGHFLSRDLLMLVLSRKRSESIVINENIVITVVEVRGDKVRLGIEAPREVPIHRSEVHDAIRNEQAAAEESDADAAAVTTPEG